MHMQGYYEMQHTGDSRYRRYHNPPPLRKYRPDILSGEKGRETKGLRHGTLNIALYTYNIAYTWEKVFGTRWIITGLKENQDK